MTHIPLMVDLRSCISVVIGGGRIAARRVGTLCDAGAKVTIISPDLVPSLLEGVQIGKWQWKRKYFEPSDLENAFIIVAATDDTATNRVVAQAAPPHALVNVVDDPSLGNFHVPVSLKRGRFTLSVATGGASPILARRIRDELARQYDESFGEKVEQLYQLRMALKSSEDDPEARLKRLENMVDSIFDNE
ncbi:NAD(P)-dependent oxidoreductase [Marininema halotolerans]|uniref:precorrin-2 dehydrogenase n=1 Tax=Marininema halotolerans TaxID=1155944 RepID=A0A1I6S2Q2_9BACL|nr:NAD(P)-dependent oxidoreductase [Marininema halotolerans]SFS71243.1 precorrin-2 dehydrogenase / sirohydrochlorin ferrochelatase [Marininema halotolerans]